MNRCAIGQGLIPAGCHGHDGHAEVDTKRVHAEEPEEGKKGHYVTSPLPEVPGRSQSVVGCSGNHDLQV